jgi:hypothetical protein
VGVGVPQGSTYASARVYRESESARPHWQAPRVAAEGWPAPSMRLARVAEAASLRATGALDASERVPSRVCLERLAVELDLPAEERSVLSLKKDSAVLPDSVR